MHETWSKPKREAWLKYIEIAWTIRPLSGLMLEDGRFMLDLRPWDAERRRGKLGQIYPLRHEPEERRWTKWTRSNLIFVISKSGHLELTASNVVTLISCDLLDECFVHPFSRLLQAKSSLQTQRKDYMTKLQTMMRKGDTMQQANIRLQRKNLKPSKLCFPWVRSQSRTCFDRRGR